MELSDARWRSCQPIPIDEATFVSTWSAVNCYGHRHLVAVVHQPGQPDRQITGATAEAFCKRYRDQARRA